MIVGSAVVLLAVTVVCSGSHDDQDSCLRFGGASCCPHLDTLDIDIDQSVMNQPVYTVFQPKNNGICDVDNICFTYFPVPDDPKTFITYISTVYTDGHNEIATFLLSGVRTGIRRIGNGRSQLTDTIFAQLECDTNVILKQRCHIYGDSGSVEMSISGVFGFSEVRESISISCLNMAKAAVRNNGLPEDDFYILPMRLPSLCVLNQVCVGLSALQKFCETVGVAFPAINRCAYTNTNAMY